MTTEEIREEIENLHNVYTDEKCEQYNVGGGYDAVYGWHPIPSEWFTEIEVQEEKEED